MISYPQVTAPSYHSCPLFKYETTTNHISRIRQVPFARIVNHTDYMQGPVLDAVGKHT